MATFTVKGSKALKTAFIATLQELGYNPYGGGTIEIISGPKDYNIEVDTHRKMFMGHTREESTAYTLPAQWDAAVGVVTSVKRTRDLPIGTGGNHATVTEGEGIFAGGNNIDLKSLTSLHTLMGDPTSATKLKSPWTVSFDTVTVGCTSGITREQLWEIIDTAKHYGIK